MYTMIHSNIYYNRIYAEKNIYIEALSNLCRETIIEAKTTLGSI